MGANSNIEWTHHTFNPTSDGKPVIGFPGYCVTPDGLVWTRWNRGGKRRFLTGEWRVKQPCRADKGHLRVELRDGKGVVRKFMVHRLVLELFSGPCPDGMEGCHTDGNPANNHISNLRWDTPQGNWTDRKRHGRGCEGEKNPSGKLTQAQVDAIRERRRVAGDRLRILAADYGVSIAMVSKIVNGEAWRG